MADDLIAAAKAEIAALGDWDWTDAEDAQAVAAVWERTAGQLQQQRDEARRDIEAPRQANAAARQRLAEILGSEQHGLAEMVLLVGERISELAEALAELAALRPAKPGVADGGDTPQAHKAAQTPYYCPNCGNAPSQIPHEDGCPRAEGSQS